VTLVAARPPLVAFNLELAPPVGLEEAREIAAAIRDGGPEGICGVRAIGVWLAGRGLAQVSCNVEDPAAAPLRLLVEAVRRHATVSGAELVGLAPRTALTGFPDDVPIRGFDPANQVIENALGL
jgi:glutamate formiminotransferase